MLSCRDMAPLLSTHSSPACGGTVVAPATKGGSISSPAGRLYGFRRQRRYKKWRRRRRTSPAQRYYITPEGESPGPVRKASADPGQNPWRPGPKARRRHQPSPAKAGVNLREYSPRRHRIADSGYPMADGSHRLHQNARTPFQRRLYHEFQRIIHAVPHVPPVSAETH